jgi:hypothetical protein
MTVEYADYHSPSSSGSLFGRPSLLSASLNEVPKGQKLQELRFDETVIGKAKATTISEFTPAKGEKAGRH